MDRGEPGSGASVSRSGVGGTVDAAGRSSTRNATEESYIIATGDATKCLKSMRTRRMTLDGLQ